MTKRGWFGSCGTGPDLATLRLLNSEVGARFLRQASSLERIDSKGTAIVGLAVTIGTFAATRSLPLPFLGPILAFLVISAAAGLLAVRVRTYHDAPEPAEYHRLGKRSEQAALVLLLAAKRSAFDKNAKILTRKARAWRVALAALVLAVAFLIPALLLKA